MAHVQISAFLMESGEEWKVVGWDEMRASCLTFLQLDGNRWIRPDACQRRSLSKIYGIPSKIGWISTHKVTPRQKLTLSSQSHRCVFAFRSGNVPAHLVQISEVTTPVGVYLDLCTKIITGLRLRCERQQSGTTSASNLHLTHELEWGVGDGRCEFSAQ